MDDNRLGILISELRKKKNLTQKDLANAISISDKSISRWECGYGKPTLESLYLMSELFEVPYNDLLKVRLSTEDNNSVVKKIIAELSVNDNKKIKRFKLFLSIAIILVLILVISLIFIHSYNKFMVYKVAFENSLFYPINGVYVETNVKDTLYLGNIKLRNVEINESDTILVDIYIKEDGKEKLLQSYSSLDDVRLESTHSYLDIKDLSKYKDNLYFRIHITDVNNQTKTYETKLKFILDFSNNILFNDDDFNLVKLDREIVDYTKIDITTILLKQGYEEFNDNSYIFYGNNYTINYLSNFLMIRYTKEVDNFTYKYNYNLGKNILEVIVLDGNYTTIQSYQYNLITENMNCQVGKCNDYENVLKELDEKVLYLFDKN